MSRYRAEEILRDLRSGRIDDYDARRQLEREYGDCSCMSSAIRHQVDDMRYGFGSPDSASYDLERERRRCEYREEEKRREEEEERRAYERHQDQLREEEQQREETCPQCDLPLSMCECDYKDNGDGYLDEGDQGACSRHN